MKTAAAILLTLTACTTTHHAAPATTTTTTTVKPLHDARGLGRVNGDALAYAVAMTTTTTTAPPVRPAVVSAPVHADLGILDTIADCESIYGQYTYKDHPHPDHISSASGKYGFLDSTWRQWRGPEGAQYARAFHAPEWVQDAAARRLFAALGTQPWNASRPCWAA